MPKPLDIEMCVTEIHETVKKLAPLFGNDSTTIQLREQGHEIVKSTVGPGFSAEAENERKSVLAKLNRLQRWLVRPEDLLQELATHTQILACIQWLGEFQILACIPLSGSVSFTDLSDLAAVPEAHLTHAVRMTASAGFLKEAEPGHVAHTALSSSFVVKPSYLDAAMFIAGTAAPTALHMPAATHRFGKSTQANETAYHIAFNTPNTFASACQESPTLRREWSAYLDLQHEANDSHEALVKFIGTLKQASTGQSRITVVDVCPKSPERALRLSNALPDILFIVQSDSTSSSPVHSTQSTLPWETSRASKGVTFHERGGADHQTVRDASVYLLTLSSYESATASRHRQIVAEFRAHFEILRASPSASIVLTCHWPSTPGANDPAPLGGQLEHVQNLLLLQLTNEIGIKKVDLLKLVTSVGDSSGHLAVVNELRTRENVVVGLEIRYQSYYQR